MSRIVSSSEPVPEVRWPLLYVGLSFTTLATLVLELALTRIFSVVFFYHFAFLAISIALFGLGAGGVISYLVTDWRGPLFSKLGVLALANSVAVIGALIFLITRSGVLGWGMLTAVYLICALPFICAGAVTSLAIAEAIHRVDRAYFFDLAGAAAGCLLLWPFLNLFGGPNTVISAAVLYAIAAAIWFNVDASKGTGRRAVSVLAALLLVTLMVANQKFRWLDIRNAKGHALPAETFVHWNSFSRVAVTGDSIVIDADAATGIAKFDFDHLSPQDRWGLLHQGPGIPYYLRPGAKTLVIGSGGGWDLARALASGSKDITAVEINPIIANTLMRDRLVRETYGLYLRPEIRVFVEDGRSFVRGTHETYGVLQATLVDTWASTAAGAFALSENNLYTTEAFYDYLIHLNPDGVLAFTRWGFDPPRESLRVVSLARSALTRLGEYDPASHVMVVRQDAVNLKGWGAQDTILISRRPFTAADVARARQGVSESKMQAVYMPGDPPRNPFGQLLETADPETFYKNYAYNVEPVGDDRPFFFYTVQPRDLWDFLRHASSVAIDYKINIAVPVLFGLLGLSIAATALVIALPRLLLGHRLPKQKGVLAFLGYFVALGAGYILIQVALIQKFILLLGHPTYALTVIIFSMLVASGIGSYTSGRIIEDGDTKLMMVLFEIFVLVVILAIISGPVTRNAVGWPLAARIFATIAIVAPPAYMMGIPFPCGLARLEKLHPPSIRWAWSINAASSVLGSAAAIFLALYVGLENTLLLGGGLYLVALLVVLATHGGRRNQPL